MKLQFISKALVVLLWLSTLAVALCWLFWKEAPFDPEPITVVLGLISTAVTALVSEFGSRLEEEEFSLPYARIRAQFCRAAYLAIDEADSVG
jgi:RsiW-degrading membrane proteinase PrsW (M82 family)